MTDGQMQDAILGWRYCKDELPPKVKPREDLKEYLVCTEDGYYMVLRWCNGWNCMYLSDDTFYKEQEFDDIVAWMPIQRPSRVGQEKVL